MLDTFSVDTHTQWKMLSSICLAHTEPESISLVIRWKRENFPVKSSNLRHCRPAHRTKDWENTRGQLSSSEQAHPPLDAGRQVSDSQNQRERGKLVPRDSILYQTASRLPVANQVFLGSWMIGIHQEGRSQGSGPQRRHTAHLRWCSCCADRKPSDWDGEVIRRTAPPGESVLAKHLVAWTARTWKGHKTQAQLSLCLFGVPKNLNLNGLDLGSTCNPGPTLDSSLAEQPGA